MFSIHKLNIDVLKFLEMMKHQIKRFRLNLFQNKVIAILNEIKICFIERTFCNYEIHKKKIN